MTLAQSLLAHPRLACVCLTPEDELELAISHARSYVAPMTVSTIKVEWSEEDARFIATAADVPGISAHGSTESEARSELTTALIGALKMMLTKKDDRPNSDVK